MSGSPLFGTDGVRGRANVELTPELALGLARAAGDGRPGAVMVGRDTRRSGQMLAAAIHAGFHAAGSDTIDLGHRAGRRRLAPDRRRCGPPTG